MVELHVASCATYLLTPGCSETNVQQINSNRNVIPPASSLWRFHVTETTEFKPFARRETTVFATKFSPEEQIHFCTWTWQQLQYEVQELQPAMILVCLDGKTNRSGVDSRTDRCASLLLASITSQRLFRQLLESQNKGIFQCQEKETLQEKNTVCFLNCSASKVAPPNL